MKTWYALLALGFVLMALVLFAIVRLLAVGETVSAIGTWFGATAAVAWFVARMFVRLSSRPPVRDRAALIADATSRRN